jgi:hypothetical protein
MSEAAEISRELTCELIEGIPRFRSERRWHEAF